MDLIIVSFIASLLIAGGMYVWDDLTRLLKEQAAEEVGAGASTPPVEVEEPSVLVASLTAAGADTSRPYDWKADVA